MAERATVDLFCEDTGHEAFARALLARLARDVGVPNPTVNARSARGGHGRVLQELKLWQRTLRRGGTGSDLLLVMVDANGEGWLAQRRNVAQALAPGLFPATVIACPDPHVEAWIAADPAAFGLCFGCEPPPPPGRPGRDAYKAWLRHALVSADVPVLTDAMSISAEFVPHMDLFAAGKVSPSLRDAVRDLNAFMKQGSVAG